MAAEEDEDLQLKKLLDDLANNDSLAQFEAWEQFASKIARQAKKNMSGVTRRESDEEDVTAGVLNSLFQRLADGRLEQPSSTAELWKLLMDMTRNKSIEEVRAKLAQKRGGGKVRGESAFDDLHNPDERGIENAVSEKRDPQTAFEDAENLADMLDSLSCEELQQIALLKMAGHNVEEIAQVIGSGVRTVQRRLQELRTWFDDHT